MDSTIMEVAGEVVMTLDEKVSRYPNTQEVSHSKTRYLQ